MDKFLITYGEDGIYRFYSEDEVEYTITLPTFGTKTIPEVEAEETLYYMREITDTDLKVKAFDLTRDTSEIILDVTDVYKYDEEKALKNANDGDQQ